MILVRSLWLAALVACGGAAHPASPAFDAKQLAVELDHAMTEMAAIASSPGDCAAIVQQLGDAERRARGPVERARQAQTDPDRAKQLTTALKAYDNQAAGRSDVIVGKLVACHREHVELQDQIQHVVDSMPTL